MSAPMELLSLAARLFTAGVFLYAAYDKVWDPANFAASVAAYDLIPLWSVNAVSVVMAWLEIIIGGLLLVGALTRAAALWASALLVFFTGLMVYSGLTGAGFDCGCFPGGGEAAAHEAGFSGAWRDLGFLAASAWTAWRPGRWLSLTGGRI
ncbi:MAG: MauE/DoxX family redox-associated membrane protein [Thermodesulfobacteriota bacterium]